MIADILSHRMIPASLLSDSEWKLNCGHELLTEAINRLYSHPDILLPLFTLANLPASNASQAFESANERGLRDFCMGHSSRIRDWLMEYRIQQRQVDARTPSWAVTDDNVMRNRLAITGGFGADIPYWCHQAFEGSDLAFRAWAIRQHIYRSVMRGPPLHGLIIRPTRASVLADSVPGLMGDVGSLRGGVEWIAFEGEEGRGPGVVRDWFSEMVSQFVRHQPPLVEHSVDAPHYLRLAPIWTHGDTGETQQLTLLEAMGRFMALSIVQDVPIALNFPVMLFARLIKQRITLQDVKSDEPLLYRSLSLVLAYNRQQLADLGGIEIYGKHSDLTKANRKDLIGCKVNSLIDSEVQWQLDAVKRGFQAVLAPFITRDFPLTPSDLRSIVVGIPTVDIDDMMRHTVLYGYTRDSPQIVWLRKLLHSYDDANRRKFLRFVTGLEAVPAGGFASLPKPVSILKRYGSADSFPSSATCHNYLRLPEYPTEAHLRERITTAIWGDGAFGEL